MNATPPKRRAHRYDEDDDQPPRGWASLAAGGLTAVVIALALGWMVFASAYGIPLGGGAPAAPTGGSTANGPTPQVNLYFTIATDPITGLDMYFPANYSVPAGIPVIFTVKNYDNGVNDLPSASDYKIAGTVGGTESVSGGLDGAPQGTITSVPQGYASHTMTVLTGSTTFNVVMVPAADSGAPSVTTFTMVFNSPGTLTWLCLAPCDPTSMATPGFMAGTITVS